jgi:hypothetical protein
MPVGNSTSPTMDGARLALGPNVAAEYVAVRRLATTTAASEDARGLSRIPADRAIGSAGTTSWMMAAIDQAPGRCRQQRLSRSVKAAPKHRTGRVSRVPNNEYCP